MAKQTGTDINQVMQEILQNLMSKLGGVQSIFLVDLKKDKLLAQYPQAESEPNEFIGIVCGNSVNILENGSKDFGALVVTEMELETKDGRQVYLSRIAEELAICIVGDERFTPGFAERLCKGKGPIRQLIIQTLERKDIPFSQI